MVTVLFLLFVYLAVWSLYKICMVIYRSFTARTVNRRRMIDRRRILERRPWFSDHRRSKGRRLRGEAVF